MPRVIVKPDHGPNTDRKYLDEQVGALHLNDDHSAEQLVERLAWAIADAETAEEEFAESVTPRAYLEVSG